MPTLQQLFELTLRSSIPADKSANMERLLAYMVSNRFYTCRSHSHNHWTGGAAEHMWAVYLIAKELRNQRISEPDIAQFATDEKLAIVCLLHDLCDMTDAIVYDNRGNDHSKNHGRKSYWILRHFNIGTPGEQHAVKDHMHRDATTSLKDPTSIREYNALHSLVSVADKKACGSAWNPGRFLSGVTQYDGKPEAPYRLRSVAMDRTHQMLDSKMYMVDYELVTFKNYNRNKIDWNCHQKFVENAADEYQKRLFSDSPDDIFTTVYNHIRGGGKKPCIVLGVDDGIPKGRNRHLRQRHIDERSLLICCNILNSLYEGERGENFRYAFTMRNIIQDNYLSQGANGGIYLQDVQLLRTGESTGYKQVKPVSIDVLMIPGADIRPFATYL